MFSADRYQQVLLMPDDDELLLKNSAKNHWFDGKI